MRNHMEGNLVHSRLVAVNLRTDKNHLVLDSRHIVQNFLQIKEVSCKIYRSLDSKPSVRDLRAAGSTELVCCLLSSPCTGDHMEFYMTSWLGIGWALAANGW